MPDPLIMYSGEEVTTAVRAWTRGYRMVCIQNPIAWHLNKFHGDRYEKDRLWDTKQRASALFAHWWRKNTKGMARSKRILTGSLLGYWGAESRESLKAYEDSSGVFFTSLYKDIENKNV